MRNYLSIITLSAYLLFVVGFSVNLHFCHGELTEISFILPAGHCTCDPGAESINCCHEEGRYFQNQTSHLMTMAKFISISCEIPLASNNTPVVSGRGSDIRPVIRIEPPERQLPIYLLNHTFIFYG